MILLDVLAGVIWVREKSLRDFLGEVAVRFYIIEQKHEVKWTSVIKKNTMRGERLSGEGQGAV